MEEDSVELTRELLLTPEGLASIAHIAALELLKEGQVTLIVNVLGLVELIPKEKVDLKAYFPDEYLDGLEEVDAIKLLVSAKIKDERIEEYLKGRDMRKG